MHKNRLKRKSKPTTISVYFNEDLHAEIKHRAAKTDVSVSQYLRHLARKDLLSAANEEAV